MEPRWKLKAARAKKHWTLEQAAEAIGVSKGGLYNWEKGKTKPFAYNVQLLCDAYGMTAEQLGLISPDEELDATLQISGEQPGEPITASNTIQQAPQQFLPDHSNMQTRSSSSFSQTSYIITEEANNSRAQEGNAIDEGRRQLMRDALGVTGTALLAPASLFQEFARVLTRPSPIEKYHLSTLEQRTALLWQYRDDNILLPGELFRAVSREAQHVTYLLDGLPPPGIQTGLLAIACKLFTLCGVLLYDHLGTYEQAREAYRLAIQAARQAEQPLLEAIASTWMSFSWTYEHRYQDAAQQITQSLSLLTDPNADAGTFAWTTAVAAEISARLGNYHESRSFLDQAEFYLPEPSHQPQRTYLHRFDEAQLNGFRGVCYQLLYDPKNVEMVNMLDQARRVLEQALLDNSASTQTLLSS